MVLSTCPASTARRPIMARMISGVKALPRAASMSEETRKNKASVSNIRPSRSKTTARIRSGMAGEDPRNGETSVSDRGRRMSCPVRP